MYPDHYIICALAGPHCDEEYLTEAGIGAFFATVWMVSSSSNRTGIRLEGPKLQWARATGGEGGSHPSNIRDTGYALGTVNLNGDTPVMLTNEGPDMDGYVCICTVATPELYVVPWACPRFRLLTYSSLQLEAWPASFGQHGFKRVSFQQSTELSARIVEYLDQVSLPAAMTPEPPPSSAFFAD